MNKNSKIQKKKPLELDKKFDLILSILLAISISQLFSKTGLFNPDYFFKWILLTIIIFVLAVLLIYYLVHHKSRDSISFVIKMIVLYLLVFFPYYLDKLTNNNHIKLYLILSGLAFLIWGCYDSIIEKKKFWKEVRFWVGGTIIILVSLLWIIDL
jgi:magnesium-transporting ATPase (P-type)